MAVFTVYSFLVKTNQVFYYLLYVVMGLNKIVSIIGYLFCKVGVLNAIYYTFNKFFSSIGNNYVFAIITLYTFNTNFSCNNSLSQCHAFNYFNSYSTTRK